MSDEVKITLSAEDEKQLQQAINSLESATSGVQVKEQSSGASRMHSDLGLYAEIVALVLSAAGAAESIFNIKERLKGRSKQEQENEDQDEPNVKVTIQKGDASYEVTNLSASDIKRIIE